MLSEKQFCERAKSELRHIGDQVQSLATDRYIYWKLEREIIQPNPQLCDSRSPVLDMLRGCYADAMTSRLVRLLDGEDGGVSLPRVVAQLTGYPQLLNDKITQAELRQDRAALERAAASLKSLPRSHSGHHERTLSALATTHRELDAALDLIIETLKTYYWIVAESYFDLEVQNSGADDPLLIFRAPWTAPTSAE